MMFELSIALKYLLPRKKQLSSSIISFISIIVISLVVWLILVFFSVTNGMEKNWIEKLVTISAPIRLTPTESYYDSYYYQIDSISHASNFNYKSIAEKYESLQKDPYDPKIDMEIPENWPSPEKDENGKLRDLVKLTIHEISQLENIKDLSFQDYEMALSHIRLNLLRKTKSSKHSQHWDSQTSLTQLSYLLSFPNRNARFTKTVIPPSPEDLSNFLRLISLSSENIRGNQENSNKISLQNTLREQMNSFFERARINKLKTPAPIWKMPKSLYPKSGEYDVCISLENHLMKKAIIPTKKEFCKKICRKLKDRGRHASPAILRIDGEKMSFIFPKEENISFIKNPPLFLEGDVSLKTTLLADSINESSSYKDLIFKAEVNLQGNVIQGDIPFNDLEIAEIQLHENDSSIAFPICSRHNDARLPSNPLIGEGVLLPKHFRDNGALLGDRGYLSYYSHTAGSTQEQRLPIYVSGFYDPGLTPTGGKLVIVNKEITSLIHPSIEHKENKISNGISIWFEDINKAPYIRDKLFSRLKEKKLEKYWKVEAYEDYDFAKDFVQQLQSDKTLFSLIAVIITIVACSNIISMLVLLVNDKKREIGILLSMGASTWSISGIFAFCGIVMGATGSCLGAIAAIFTLKHLQILVKFLSVIQGHEAFNSIFYGDSLPNELSYEALSFVLITTAIVSTLAGIIPAIKASLLRPSAILRSE